MAYIDFVETVHKSTKRNYLERVINYDKKECTKIARGTGRG